MSLGVANEKIWGYMNQNKTIEATCRYVKSNDIKGKKEVSIDDTKRLLVDCLQKNIQVVCYSEPEYPTALKSIENPPCVLFCRGNINLLNHNRLLTVVGTRKPSDYTVGFTNDICNNLLDHGFMFISGLAVGVDCISQQCSVNRNIPTIAVVACGIDYIYPKANETLRSQILQQGGLLLTEQLPNDRPYPQNFIKRNRILANLSQATLVTEAGISSGALSTVKFAFSSGKTVFAVSPLSIHDDAYQGLVKCIRDGAVCTFGYEDILYEYSGEFPLRVRKTDIAGYRSGKAISDSPIFNTGKDKHLTSAKAHSTTSTTKSAKSTTKKSTTPTKSKTPPKEVPTEVKSVSPPLDKNQALVVESIRNGYTCLDDISKNTSISISELFAIVTELEIDGIIQSGFGNVYTLV